MLQIVLAILYLQPSLLFTYVPFASVVLAALFFMHGFQWIKALVVGLGALIFSWSFTMITSIFLLSSINASVPHKFSLSFLLIVMAINAILYCAFCCFFLMSVLQKNTAFRFSYISNGCATIMLLGMYYMI